QRFSWVYWSVARNACGGLYSSGIRNGLSSRDLGPRPTRPEITDTGVDSINDPTIGTSQQRKPGCCQITNNAQQQPSKVCGPWRLTASLQGVESSSRCGEFQVAAQPRNAASTKRVWKIIRTGASSMENSISSSIDNVTLNLPPNSFAPLAQI